MAKLPPIITWCWNESKKTKGLPCGGPYFFEIFFEVFVFLISTKFKISIFPTACFLNSINTG